jgi:hypothetical protein
MRKSPVANVLLASAAMVAFTACMAAGAVQRALTLHRQGTIDRVAGAPDDIVDDIRRRVAALSGAISDAARGEPVMTLGRTLMTGSRLLRR